MRSIAFFNLFFQQIFNILLNIFGNFTHSKTFYYYFSILAILSLILFQVLGSPEVSSNSLDPSVANELEELKKYADVASEAVLMLKNPKMVRTFFPSGFIIIVIITIRLSKKVCSCKFYRAKK